MTEGSVPVVCFLEDRNDLLFGGLSGVGGGAGVLHGVLGHDLEVLRLDAQGAQVLGAAPVLAKGLQGDMPWTLMSMVSAMTANRSRLPIRLNS